jgi:hypothetical protein
MAFRSPTKPSSQTDMMASCVSALPADAPVACAGAAVKMIILLLNRLHQVKFTTTKRVLDFIGGFRSRNKHLDCRGKNENWLYSAIIVPRSRKCLVRPTSITNPRNKNTLNVAILINPP